MIVMLLFQSPCECVYFTIVPAAPSSCNITLSYSQLSGKLLFIDTTWNTVSVSHLDLPSNMHVNLAYNPNEGNCVCCGLKKEHSPSKECPPPTFGSIFCIASLFMSAHPGVSFTWLIERTCEVLEALCKLEV